MYRLLHHARPPSVVVQVIDEFYVPVDESECHSPVSIHPDRPMVAEFARQRMHAKSRNIDVPRYLGYIQSREDATELWCMNRLHSPVRILLIQRLETLVPETRDHV